MHSVESNNRVPSPYIPYTPSSPRWPQIIAGAFVVYAGLRSSMPMKAVCIIAISFTITFHKEQLDQRVASLLLLRYII